MPFLTLLPEGFHGEHYLKFMAAFILGFAIISIVARMIFGRKSTLNRSVSCAIAILCIYVVNVVIYSAGVRVDSILSPLPFVSLSGDELVIFRYGDAGFTGICSQILDMLILALVMVLLDNLLPQGKKFPAWLGWRFVRVILGIIANFLLRLLLDAIIPEGILTFAPAVLLIVLLVSMLLSVLKLIIGGALAFISPVLAFFYAFFFQNLIGKQLRKAILTTAILSALVLLLNYLGIGSIAIGSAALLMYLPILLIALALWFLITHLL